jgi:hypothetical protein
MAVGSRFAVSPLPTAGVRGNLDGTSSNREHAMSKQKKDRSDWDVTEDAAAAADDDIDQDDVAEDRAAPFPDEDKSNPNDNQDRPPGEEDDVQ